MPDCFTSLRMLRIAAVVASQLLQPVKRLTTPSYAFSQSPRREAIS